MVTVIKHINYNPEYNELNYHNKKTTNNNNYNLFVIMSLMSTRLRISHDLDKHITNNIIELNTQTINYIGNNFLIIRLHMLLQHLHL